MKRYRVQVTTTEVFECWLDADDWEAAEETAMVKYGAGDMDLVSSVTYPEVIEEEDDN